MTQPTVLAAHIYGGGFSLGASRHFKLLGQLEEGPWGADTFEDNFPGVFHPLNRKEWKLDQFKNINLFITNPPCAVFSTIGSGMGYLDPRFKFTENCYDAALELLPDVFIEESVCRAWSAGKEYFVSMAEKFNLKGYAVTILLTNGILHNGFQHRERFHFIAHRGRLDLKEPHIRNVPTVGDVIGDLEKNFRWTHQSHVIPNHVVREPNPIEEHVMNSLAEGEGYNRAVERLETETGVKAQRWRLLAKRLRWDQACSTIAALDQLIHPHFPRQLTLREGARLCGYPDSFVVRESLRHTTHNGRQEDLTQAVLPPMGEYLANLALSTLGNDMQDEPFRFVDWRKQAKRFRKISEDESNGDK